MNNRPVVHGSFVIDRSYDAPASRVFAAWADPAMKERWFIGPAGWTLLRRELDFRVGGQEVAHGRFAGGGGETIFIARYHDIVQDRRIVFAYDMHWDGAHRSVSLATVEIMPDGAKRTKLRFTEQIAFLDGNDGTAARERGTAGLLERVADQLRLAH
jgi:uncharacterized protein YndB with AHSA1/START domain